MSEGEKKGSDIFRKVSGRCHMVSIGCQKGVKMFISDVIWWQEGVICCQEVVKWCQQGVRCCQEGLIWCKEDVR